MNKFKPTHIHKFTGTKVEAISLIPNECVLRGESGDAKIISINSFYKYYSILENEAVGSKHDQEKDTGKHYRFEYKGIKLDPFRISKIFNLDAVQLTILKKTLVTGKRGNKNKKQDLLDIIGAAQRGLEMMEEDNENN